MKVLNKNNLFLANVDFETDLYNSTLSEQLKKHYQEEDFKNLVNKMKEHKGINIYDFLMFAYILECNVYTKIENFLYRIPGKYFLV